MIRKRNNQLSPVHIGEIRNALEWASEGLDLNYLELESHVDSIYRENISTSEIQKSLIDIALTLTTVERPQWRFMAARLLLMEIYKEVKYNRESNCFGYGTYVEYLELACSKGLYDDAIFTHYTKRELELASTFINPRYDFDYDYAGICQLITKYLIKDKDRYFELPQEMYITIALYLARHEDKALRMEYVKSFYHLIAGRKISLATPILINLRKKNANLSSCFITAIDDTLENIFYNITSIAKISKNGGGVGVNISRIRAKGAQIKETPNASGGVIPWIRIINDTAVAVNQLGKRAGAVTVALDIWHLDIEDFLELQTENGDQRKKAYDIFPQVVIPDLFMERVEANTDWLLLDPDEVKRVYSIDPAELWGDEFRRVYSMIEEEGKLTLTKTLKARELFKVILKTTIETGMPYIFFKDTVNKNNPNRHDGMIGSGNLCQESFSNFRPARVEGSMVNDDTITQTYSNGLVHTCNLVSLNLATIKNDELATICRSAVRILDNTLDLTSTPIEESNIHNKRYRTIGVGALGLADYLAHNKVAYEKSHDVVDALFEDIAFHVVGASVELAKERGAYPLFKGSLWDQGIVFGKDRDWFGKHVADWERWFSLIDDLQKYGIRNSQVLAIAPNTSSALLQGASSSVLPIFSKFHIDKSSIGAVPICPPFLKEAFWYYKENKHIDQRTVVEIIARIQKWVDQGISFEVLYNLNNDIRARDVYDTIVKAWHLGCKTVYYTRTIQRNGNISVGKEECVSCAN